MKNNKNFKYIFIIIIVILLFIVIGATYFLKDSSNDALPEINNSDTSVLNTGGVINNDDENISSVDKEVSTEPISTSTKTVQNTENTIVKEAPKIVLPELTLPIIKGLVSKSWRKCPSTDCKSVEVTLGMDNLVTAIYTDISNSVNQSKFEGFVKAKDNKWVLGEPSITRTCNREHSDGTFGFSESPCI